MSYTILIADDDKEFREEFIYCFDEYTIVEAGTGQQTLDILNSPNEIDLIFLDVFLPDTTGIILLKTIRESYPEIAIVILTGSGSKDIVLDALRGEADDYLEKPLDIEKTQQLIKKLIETKIETMDVKNGKIEDKIQRVMNFAERNVNKMVNLEDVAKLVYMSPKYLSRVFKQYTGMNFSRYKINIKIKHSKKLLENKGLSVEQISDNLGYENSESFIRIFKKYTKMTPTQYRKSIECS
ncbi:MAG: response regulator transcription factor [Candidatus Margulisbacteria bacterium]|nr:response regulator transcription factor [Candidatus Margulisiibacteriota bacterium]